MKKSVKRQRFSKKKRGAGAALVNLVLAGVLLCVGAVCVQGGEGTVAAAGKENLYFRGAERSDGVSLMFNVYENTSIVYAVLETLKEQGAKATFFVGGCWADDNEKCLKEIVNGGHEIGNHGYFHKDHTKLTQKENKAEILRCNEVIRAFSGKQAKLFAPPSGAYDQTVLSAAAELNMKVILWAKDTIDWRDRNASLIFRRATKGVTGGDFVLMHPTEETAKALKDVLVYYKTHSLRAVTVSENIEG